MMIDVLHLIWILPATGAVCFTIAAVLMYDRSR